MRSFRRFPGALFFKDRLAVISFVLICLLLGCFEVRKRLLPLPAHDWNRSRLKEIRVADPGDFSFAVFGDNSNSGYVFENILTQVDHDPDIAFAVHLGDMVQTGEKERYRWFLQQVRNHLGIPLLTSMGSHERRGKGPGLYQAIFGLPYYSFKIGRNRFIFLDNSDERGPDTAQRKWLEQELENVVYDDTRMVFMHLPLYDPRGARYHQCLPEEYTDPLLALFRKHHVTHIFTSHLRGYFEGQWQGIPFTITGGGGAELEANDPAHAFFHFLKVRIKDRQLHIEMNYPPIPPSKQMGRFGYMAWLYISSFFRFHGIQTLLLVIAGGLLMVICRRREGNKLLLIRNEQCPSSDGYEAGSLRE